MPDDLSRRGFMGFLGAAAGSLGLSKLFGSDFPKLKSSVSTTEDWSPPFHVDDGDELDDETSSSSIWSLSKANSYRDDDDDSLLISSSSEDAGEHDSLSSEQRPCVVIEADRGQQIRGTWRSSTSTDADGPL